MTRPALLVLLLAVATVLAGCGGSGSPTDDQQEVQASVAPVDGEDEETAAPSPTDEPSDEPTEEASDEPEPPTFDEVCAGREDEAFIEVLTPLPGTTVTDPVTVTGCGNTFEANYLYRVEAADGTVLVEDFGTMSCGNGCVGEFTVDIEVGATGDVLLTVYEASAKDGSPQHVVEVPLTVE